MSKRTITAISTALALGAAGCGGDDDEDQANTTPATTPAQTQTQPQTQQTQPGAAQTVNMSASEFSFSPANVTVRAGQVTFNLRNTGGAPHALEVEGQGIEEETRVIQGGQSATLRVNLRPGMYTMYCPVGNHRQQGMEGTLRVT
jgi:plastocyanin